MLLLIIIGMHIILVYIHSLTGNGRSNCIFGDMLRVVSRVWRGYISVLDSRPLLTQAITTGVLAISVAKLD